MKRSVTSYVFANGRMFLFLGVVALVAALGILPYYMTTRAQIKTGKGLFTRTETFDPQLPDYDIRDIANAKDDGVMDFFAAARASAGTDAVVTADLRDGFARGEEKLRTQVPTLNIEYNGFTGAPELIAPDPLQRRAVLTSPTTDRVGTLRNFIKSNDSLVGMPDEQIDALRVQTDFVNKKGGIGLVIFEQLIDDVPVFRGELSGHFSNKGELFRVVSNVATGIDHSRVSRVFGDPANAVRIAAENVGFDVDMTLNTERSTDDKVYFGSGYYPASAWKQYFSLEPGVVRPVWYVQVWGHITAYEMIIDAETGKVLWRVNMGKDQTQSVQYNVWSNLTSFNLTMDSPAPLTPGPIDPSTGTQGTLQARTVLNLIGNEGGNPGANTNGWITDGGNTTSGNNTVAGLDRDTTNGPEVVTGSPNRVFNFAINPAPGNPAPGDEPIPAGDTPTPCDAAPPAQNDYQKASVTQMFYAVNRLHDVLYAHGFTELTRNFQTDNFGRGGAGADAVLSEGQDCAGTNNANMASSTTDGTLARMQMFLWTPPTPVDRDGTMDAEIVLHEIGHGVTNRNHINGISGTQGGQMHEGGADFQAHLLLSEATDPINGVYTTGGYSTLNLRAAAPFSNVGNYYYGIRRYPKAVRAFTGGAGNLPHNPLTYADIDPAQHNPGGGAFAPAFTGSATLPHDGGEIWSSMLWEVRSRLVQRLGHAAGTSRMLQLWMDGMRLTTSTSSMLNSRNAMLQAAQFTGASPELTAADVADVWAGFAARGLGFSAQNPTGNTVVEAFNLPQLSGGGAPSVTSGNNLIEPNECNTLNVPLSNNSAENASGITAVLSSTTPGVTVTQPNSAYPDIPSAGGPTNNTTPFQVSTDNTVACFTQASFTLTVTYTGGGGGSPLVINFSLPVGLAGTNYAFVQDTSTIPAGAVGPVAGSQVDDAAVAITLPAAWNSTIYGVPVTSLSASTNGMLTANGAAATTFTNTALPGAVGGTNPTLFPYWDDFDMDPADTVGGGIFTTTVGAAPNRQFYVEWRATHFSEAGTTPTINVAVLLTEGSDVVRYIYPLTGVGTQLNGLSATVGIQRQTGAGNPLTQFSFNASSLQPGWQLTGARPAGMCTPGNGGCVVGNSADLSITKTDGVTTVNPGQMITYAIVASNAGPSPVVGATVTDTFPAALTGVTWTCVGAGGGTCTAAGAGNINDTVNLPVGGSVTYTANATVNPAATFGFSNTARVAVPQGTTDPVMGNNSARDTDAVCPPLTFSNTGTIAIPATGTTSGISNPYPSNIAVAGLTGTVTDVNVTLNGLNHTFPDDMDMLLVGPGFQNAIILSDVGTSLDVVNVNLTLDDAAATNLPDAAQIVSGTFRPTNIGAGDTFAAPAPAPLGGTPLSIFNGTAPNGTWSLYIVDDLGGDTGNMSGGWSLTFTTSGGGCPTTAAGVTVSGRVITPEGYGLRNAIVTITDSTGMIRTARTSSFGYYTLEGIEVGGTYVMSVGSKRYTFTPRTLSVNDAMTDVDFVAQGSE